MQGRKAAIYRRGDKYWLAWDERKDGTRRSPYLTIFWYDSTTRRTRSASTGETTEEAGMIALDRRYLADRGQAPAFCESSSKELPVLWKRRSVSPLRTGTSMERPW